VLVDRAARFFVEEQITTKSAVIDTLKPLCPLFVDLRFDAATVKLHAVVPLGINVGTFRVAIAKVVGELVYTDLVTFGLGVNAEDESGEENAQNERNETSHDV
jgi:hypothetical protein